MEEHFWSKLARLVTKNTSKNEKVELNSGLSSTEKKEIIRDSELLMGRSSKKIKQNFEELTKKLDPEKMSQQKK